MTSRPAQGGGAWRAVWMYLRYLFEHSSKGIELVLLAAIATTTILLRETWVHFAALAVPIASIVGKLLFESVFERTAEKRLKLFDEVRTQYAKTATVTDELQLRIQRLVEAQLRFLRVRRAARRVTDEAAVAPSARAVTVIEEVVRSRRNNQQVASMILLLALGAYTLFGHLTKTQTYTWLLATVAGAIVLVNTGVVILNYRVARGLYGTNEYEAREIISFILSHADDVDFSSGLGARDPQLSDNDERVLVAAWDGVSA